MEQKLPSSKTQHSRDTFWMLIIPMLLLVLLVTAGVVIVALFPRRVQVGIVADWLITVFMLCPLALCTLPVTLLMIGAVFGLNRVHGAAARPLRKLTDRSTTLAQRAHSTANQINQRAIDTSARFGWLHRWLGVFEDKTEGKAEIHESTDQPGQ